MPTKAIRVASMALLCLGGVVVPASAEEPEERQTWPDTWSMTAEELEAEGLGQRRADPVPVPEHYPRLNLESPPVAGGSPPPKIIFVNFDGATLVAGMDDAKNNMTQLDELVGEFAPYGTGDKRTAVLQATRADWAAYNISVVDTRPSSGEYTMNMTGPTNPFGGGVLGIAPVDCGNFQTHSNITYAFHDVNDMFDAPTTATTIGQEVAHSYGLEHVNAPQDILNPTNAGGDPSFVDECLPLTSGAFCPDQHLLHCPDGQGQNSHQELLTMFGPSIPDVEGPIITVTAPLTGTVYEDGNGFTVIAEIVDESIVDEATLYDNGMLVDIDTTSPWGWQMMDLAPGLHALEIVAVDEYGNDGLSTPVSILIGGDPIGGGSMGGVDSSGGGGMTASSGGQPGGTETAGIVPGNEGCGCTQGRDTQGRDSGVPVFAWALLLLALGRPRREFTGPRTTC